MRLRKLPQPLILGRLRRSAMILIITALVAKSDGVRAQTNLALNKPVMASGAADTTIAPLSNLTDGDLTTYASVANAATGNNADWIRIDLGGSRFIETIRIIARPGFHNRARRFMLLTWDDSIVGPNGLGNNPRSYLTDSRFNRLIYTDPAGVTSVPNTVFGSTAAVPGAAGTLMGPDFTTLQMNIGVHKARYIMLLNLQHDFLDLNEIEVFPGQSNVVRTFSNGGFENGTNTTGVVYVREGLVPGWSTTEAVAMAASAGITSIPTDGSFIELWSNGTNGVPSYSGNYFAELNAYTAGELSQRPVCVLAGETFSFSFAHRGRNGVDTMRLRIDDIDVAEFFDNNAQSGTHTGMVLTPATTTLNPYTTDANGWTNYSGTWTNNTGSGKIVTFGYRAVGTGTGVISIGNFLDSVRLASLNATVTFDLTTQSGTESIPTANLPKLLITGTIAAPASIQIALSGTATRGDDYVTPTFPTGPITVNIPAGNYDGTPATAISLAPYIQIVADTTANESNETIVLQLQNPSASLLIADVSSCRLTTAIHTYTIIDTPPISISGTVFDDGNGLSDSTVNGTGTNAGGLNAVLIHDNIIIGSTAVPANGSYSFSNLVPGQNYWVMITNTTPALGNMPPYVVLPDGWVNTGENLGTAPGSDGVVNGQSVVITPTSNVVNLNFGIEQLPQSSTSTAAVEPLPSGTNTATVAPTGFGGSDPDGTVDSIQIISFPTNTTSISIGGIIYYPSSGAIPAGCSSCEVFPSSGITMAAPGGIPSQVIEIDPSGNSATSVVITYSAKDNAGFIDPTPGSLTLPFGNPLPVTWLYFDAKAAGVDAVLNWATAYEANASRFEIEFATVGAGFKKLDEVIAKSDGASTSKYEFIQTDAGLLGASIQYRLKQIDVDGRFCYSVIRNVTFGNFIPSATLYPNPIKRGQSLTVCHSEIREVVIFSASGKKLFSTTYNGENRITISTKALTPGFYFLSINNEQRLKVAVQQ